MNQKRILIAAGGSGGHIFPAIAMARAMRESSDVDIRFVGSSKALDRRIFEKEGFNYSTLSSNKFPYGLSLKLFPFSFKLILDIIRSKLIVLSYKPDVVIGFGGYVACPIVLAASIFGIPRIVHEQNVVPGRANKFLFRFADKIALSFNETLKYAGPAKPKCVFTGNPIRGEMLKGDRSSGIKRFGLDESKFTILVIGGSQGAHFLNENFIAAFEGFDGETRRSFQVIHLTGVKDYEWAIKMYSALHGLESRVYSFIDRIEEAYSAADLIITRAGASAIFEIAHFAKPMILVPYPFAMNHQAENAKVFRDNGAAIMVEEKDLIPKVFKEHLLRLFRDKEERRRLMEAAKRMARPAASTNLAIEVLRLSEK